MHTHYANWYSAKKKSPSQRIVNPPPPSNPSPKPALPHCFISPCSTFILFIVPFLLSASQSRRCNTVGGLVVSNAGTDMQIIRAATAKSDWRRRACDFAVVDSPLSPPPRTRTHVQARQGKRERIGQIHRCAWQIDYWPDRGICLNVITPVWPWPLPDIHSGSPISI